MKINATYLIFALLMGLTSLTTMRAEDSSKHLFILSGQSNMARLDPDETFTPTLNEAFGSQNVVVVKVAQGGQPIQRWYKGWSYRTFKNVTPGDLYEQLIEKVKEQTEKHHFETVTFLWMQGERDAREDFAVHYEEAFKGIIAQLEEDLGRNDIQVVIGRLSDYGNDKPEDRPYWMMLRELQVAMAEGIEYGAWVNTDDLNDGINHYGKAIQNDLHYSVEGYKLFGERLAEAAIGLIELRAATRH